MWEPVWYKDLKKYHYIKSLQLCYAQLKQINVATHLPEVINFPINKWLILPFNDIEVFDIAGIQILFHNKSKETVIWSVSCKLNNKSVLVHHSL